MIESEQNSEILNSEFMKLCVLLFHLIKLNF